MQALKKLFAYYAGYHGHDRPLLKYIGLVAASTYVVFYFIRFTKPNPKPFDDIGMRLVIVMLFGLLALRDQWPDRLRRFYLPYSYAALIFCLPFFNVYMALDRHGGVPAISNCFIALTFLVLVADWRNVVAMLTVGIAAAAALYFSLHPEGAWPRDVLLQIPAYLIIVIGAAAFKLSDKQIDAEKSRLAAALAGSIAHEMRHPLGRLKLSLESIQQQLPRPVRGQEARLSARDLEALYRHLAESELAVQRGLQVISMTLDQVSAKPIDTQAFTVLSAAEATLKAVQEYGYDSEEERERVELRIDADFSFLGDETAYLFVVFNLIRNALYYAGTRPGLRVEVLVQAQQVRVRDNGPGIPPQLLSRLFEPFRTAGKLGGTGLGLAYCDRVMRAFGGSIRCQSVQGDHTEFTLAFPQVEEHVARLQRLSALGAAQAAFAGRRLLVVDDDALQRAATRQKLQPVTAAMDEASSGDEALAMAARRPYDLVLLDLNMPGLDGYAVAERLRLGHGVTAADVAIVAHTAEPAHLASVKTQNAGMDGFVAKPCTQLALLQSLVRALERAQARRLPTPEFAGRAVLVVDDSHWNRKAVAAGLQQAGLQAVQAGGAAEALQTLRTRSDWLAVVTDIQMPGMNGVDLACAIARGEAGARVPVIGLSAHCTPAIVQQGRDAGIRAFLDKPVEQQALLEALRLCATGDAADGTTPMPSVVSPRDAGPLLDRGRIESYCRIGMFEELIGDYLPEIGRVLQQLEDSTARADLEASVQALHTLLGMSGEAGATALHRMVRRVYVGMAEDQRWPAGEAWLREIRELARETDQALRAYTP
jgi:two-component system, CAI-1 autoinducer sensor kinase/phosphatase CqsS